MRSSRPHGAKDTYQATPPGISQCSSMACHCTWSLSASASDRAMLPKPVPARRRPLLNASELASERAGAPRRGPWWAPSAPDGDIVNPKRPRREAATTGLLVSEPASELEKATEPLQQSCLAVRRAARARGNTCREVEAGSQDLIIPWGSASRPPGSSRVPAAACAGQTCACPACWYQVVTASQCDARPVSPPGLVVGRHVHLALSLLLLNGGTAETAVGTDAAAVTLPTSRMVSVGCSA